MDRQEYLRRWSALHGGVDVDRPGWVRGWLSISHWAARPLVAARVPPDAVTLVGLTVAVCAVLPALAGGRWVLLVVPVVVLSALVDSLDGAVAVMTDRTTRWGYVLDSVCDRLSDSVYVVVLWVLGAPGWLVVLGGGLAALQEYVRARAGAGGLADVGVVTISERPTRVVLTAMFVLGAGIYPSAASWWATAGASAWATLGLVGTAQLLLVVRRRLR